MLNRYLLQRTIDSYQYLLNILCLIINARKLDNPNTTNNTNINTNKNPNVTNNNNKIKNAA